ncbi:MAG: DUF4412 domain-containing protein [Bacteroidales bacterium]|nr:DUF4412 domain-containing protein [Bacteroidales bacterium]MBN2698709.1 DUF4412 domain-containing protein [Bacteroidales bacterium]
MKRIVIVFILCLLVTGMNELFSQDLGRFVRKRMHTADDAIEERVDKETDSVVVKGVNKSIDVLKSRILGTSGSSSSEGEPSEKSEVQAEPGSTETTKSSGSGASSSGDALGKAIMGAMGMSANVAVKDQYNFDSYVKMEVSSYDKSGTLEETGIYDTYNNVEALDYAMIFYDAGNQGDKSTIIFDTENHLMLTLSESGGEKTGFAISIDPEDIEEPAEGEVEEVEEDAYKAYKTGKTKTILGYKCEEYLIEDEESEARIYVTDDINQKARKEVMKNSVFAGWFFHAAYMKGMVLEYDLLDKTNGERIFMQVKDLDMNTGHSVSTKGFNIIGMKNAPKE